MKKTLTESELINMISMMTKHSIDRLSEAMMREPALYNDEGEMIDRGGWYDPDDYADDEYDEYAANRAFNDASDSFAQRILDGEFDDKIFDSDWCEQAFDDHWNSDTDYDGNINGAIQARRKEIDKDYAMKYGKNPDNYDVDKVWYEKNYPKDANYNVDDRPSHQNHIHSVLGKDGWKHDDIESGWLQRAGERMQDENPALHDMFYKKDGNLRGYKAVKRNLDKYDKPFNDADKKPLHRKDSLNATLSESRLKEIVLEGVFDAMKDAIARNGYSEGKPEKLTDVINGNMWKVLKVLKNDRFEKIFLVVKNGDVPTERFLQSYDTGGALPFEDLIEDINIFYQDKGQRYKAEEYPTPAGSRGMGIRVYRY